MAVWRCGGVAVWRCGGVAVWRCGGVAVWRCGTIRRGDQIVMATAEYAWGLNFKQKNPHLSGDFSLKHCYRFQLFLTLFTTNWWSLLGSNQ